MALWCSQLKNEVEPVKLQTWMAGLALATVLCGCSQQTQQQVENTGQAVVTDVKENAQQAVDVTKDAVADAELTASVKSALIASDKLDHSALNVDTSAKVVYLRGHVPTVDQKSLAEEIAKNTVSAGVTVQNELSVGAPGTAPSVSTTASPGTITDDAHEGHDHGDHEGHDHSDHEDHSHEAAATVTPAASSAPHDHSHEGDHSGHQHD
jgi:hypothetical protein